MIEKLSLALTVFGIFQNAITMHKSGERIATREELVSEIRSALLGIDNIFGVLHEVKGVHDHCQRMQDPMKKCLRMRGETQNMTLGEIGKNCELLLAHYEDDPDRITIDNFDEDFDLIWNDTSNENSEPNFLTGIQVNELNKIPAVYKAFYEGLQGFEQDLTDENDSIRSYAQQNFYPREFEERLTSADTNFKAMFNNADRLLLRVIPIVALFNKQVTNELNNVT